MQMTSNDGKDVRWGERPKLMTKFAALHRASTTEYSARRETLIKESQEWVNKQPHFRSQDCQHESFFLPSSHPAISFQTTRREIHSARPRCSKFAAASWRRREREQQRCLWCMELQFMASIFSLTPTFSSLRPSELSLFAADEAAAAVAN